MHTWNAGFFKRIGQVTASTKNEISGVYHTQIWAAWGGTGRAGPERTAQLTYLYGWHSCYPCSALLCTFCSSSLWHEKCAPLQKEKKWIDQSNEKARNEKAHNVKPTQATIDNPIICWISWTFPSQRTSLPFYLKTFSTLHILYNESIQRSMILRSRIPGFETGTASSEACNKPLSISPVFTKRSPTILTIFQDL